MLCSWLCVFRLIFVLPFQFDRFYEVFFRCNVLYFPSRILCYLIYYINVMLYVSQHVIHVTLRTIPMWFDFRFLFYVTFLTIYT